jgi:hypothetical protein
MNFFLLPDHDVDNLGAARNMRCGTRYDLREPEDRVWWYVGRHDLGTGLKCKRTRMKDSRRSIEEKSLCQDEKVEIDQNNALLVSRDEETASRRNASVHRRTFGWIWRCNSVLQLQNVLALSCAHTPRQPSPLMDTTSVPGCCKAA